jgi:hypothetical protein
MSADFIDLGVDVSSDFASATPPPPPEGTSGNVKLEKLKPAEDPNEKLQAIMSLISGESPAKKEKLKSLKNSTDMEAILYRLNALESATREIERLRRQVKDLEKATSVGAEIAEEVKKEVAEEKQKQDLLADTHFLKENEVKIPFLEKQKEELLFKENRKRRTARKKRMSPLTEKEINDAYKECPSAMRAAKRLGVSYVTFKKYAKQYNIFKVKPNESRRPDRAPINPFKGKYPLDKILNGDFPNFPVHRLKDKLIRAGIKKMECELCGFKERRITDGKIPLLLNFEDNDNHNHKVDNLRVFCYNCTFITGKGYIKRGTALSNMDPDVIQGAKFPLKARF